MTIFGKKLKKYREKAGMTISELAQKTGINGYNIIAFEDSGRSPRVVDLIEMAYALKIETTELL